jgi:Swiss Army Knife RNA repair-like protein
MPPILFLDIDGVLNDHQFCPNALSGQIQRDKVLLLNAVLKVTGANVVLSSAWRYLVYRGEATVAGLDWLLRSHGMFAGRLIGITPPDSITREAYSGDPSTWPVVNERGGQVESWLAAHAQGSAYVVLDDLDLGISECGHPFVQTDGKVGLTEADALRVIELFQKQEGQ